MRIIFLIVASFCMAFAFVPMRSESGHQCGNLVFGIFVIIQKLSIPISGLI